MRSAAATIAILLSACATQPTDSTSSRLLGTWEATGELPVRVTYAANGTWQSSFVLAIDGSSREFRGAGTWKIEDGAIHNTTLAADEIPGIEPVELPFVSIEKIVSVQAHEYRYVCPVQGCTNTMRRIDR